MEGWPSLDEGICLESRRACKRSVGSNPTPFAKKEPSNHASKDSLYDILVPAPGIGYTLVRRDAAA